MECDDIVQRNDPLPDDSSVWVPKGVKINKFSWKWMEDETVYHG